MKKFLVLLVFLVGCGKPVPLSDKKPDIKAQEHHCDGNMCK